MHIRHLYYVLAIVGVCFIILPASAAALPTSVSVVIVVVPNAPSDLTAVSTAPTQVVLTWTNNSNNEDGFSVERKTGAGGTYAQIGITATDIATYTDNSVTPATTYFYRVRAFAGSNYSPYSDEASVTTAYAAPSTPVNFLVLATTTNPDGSVSATTTNATAASTISSGIDVAVNIPAGTAITGPPSWDGTLMLPEATTTFTAPTSYPGYTASAIVAIAIGAGNTPLTFDSAARLLFAGQTGKLVGWSRGGAFTEVTAVCSTDTQTVGDALPAGGDCKFDNGTDLIVWTKHFTTYVIYVQTAIPAPAPSGPVGGGGGAGLYFPPTSNTNVTIAGSAYPLSEVVILKDGQIAIKTVAGPDGIFTAIVNNLSGGNYIFSVYGEDDAGRRSTLFTFPISITVGATTEISGVFLSPTIDVDKEMVRKGDTITIFGASIPNAAITIQVDSAEPYFLNATSDKSGAYLYDFNSASLDYGSHAAKSEAAQGDQISDYSVSRGFTVGDHTVLAQAESTAPTEAEGDLNGDGRVNLIDFSILAYWYGHPNPPAAYRLDGADTIDLRDFSIMAYYWTG